jgi:hypothetical protein
MEQRQNMRAADVDRQAVVDRLRRALDEGRLNLGEYDERLGRAYRAVTYRDLDGLLTDLPASPPPAVRTPDPAPVRGHETVPRTGVIAGMPRPLRVVWTVWLTVLSINLVVWGLVSLSGVTLAYFWPMWLGVPTTALLGITAVTGAVHRARHDRRDPGTEDPATTAAV